jgi:ABC-type transporter Mla MlaB component
MMEKSESVITKNISSDTFISESATMQIESEKKENNAVVKNIIMEGDHFIIHEVHPGEILQLNGESPADKLPGVLIKGVQYYDLKNIGFINNTGMANLIELLKSLLKQGVEVQFVNVNENIKNKINWA